MTLFDKFTDQKKMDRDYGMLVDRDPNKTPEFKMEDRPLTAPGETFESDDFVDTHPTTESTTAPAAPTTTPVVTSAVPISSKIVAVDKKVPQPVRILGQKVHGVEHEYYSLSIFKEVAKNPCFIGQIVYRRTGRMIETHGIDMGKVLFDSIHLANQGLRAEDTSDPDDVRSNRTPSKDVR